MSMTKAVSMAVLIGALSGCASDGSFNSGAAAAVGAGVLAAAMLDEKDVAQAATAYAKELDGKSKLAPADNPYSIRLAKLTRGLKDYAGLKLVFKVYLTPDINAFAMADGTVRVYSGLMDAMPDDQLLAVIGHEIGHVRLKHTYRQMREQLLTNTAFQAVAASGGTIGELTSSQLGALAYQAVNARFSQSDELESDEHAVKMLHGLKRDPKAMLRAIETLERISGSGGGFLSSHPSSKDRKANIKKAIKRL